MSKQNYQYTTDPSTQQELCSPHPLSKPWHNIPQRLSEKRRQVNGEAKAHLFHLKR